MMRAVVCLLAAAALSSSCAARSSPPPAALERGRIDTLLRQGCYDCLQEAVALYGSGPALTLVDRRGLFALHLVSALRELELALDPPRSLARARAAAAEIASGSPSVLRLMAIVETLPPDAPGTPRASRRPPPIVAAAGAREKYLDEALATIRSSGLPAVATAYLELSVRCAVAPDTVRGAATPTDPPLLRYKGAICVPPLDVAALEQVRTEVPRFVETSLFRGREAMATLAGTDGARARAFLEEAYARFPDSPSVTLHLATVAQATGDCRTADRYFGETLASSPRHEDARLGRAICRTYLSRHDEAIADATLLVDGDAYNRAEAYYWRAWNHRLQKNVSLARADVDRARALLYNARVLTLAGMIEYDQQEFDKASDDLEQARKMDSRECQARWYLGLIGYTTETWDASARGFADAADCYATLIADTERQREALRARTDLSEDFRTRQLAGFAAAIAEDRTQKSAADLNAAINYGRAQDLANATIYMKRAWDDPERRRAVEDLRQVLGVPRW